MKIFLFGFVCIFAWYFDNIFFYLWLNNSNKYNIWRIKANLISEILREHKNQVELSLEASQFLHEL